MTSNSYLRISELASLLNDTLEIYVGERFFEGELQEITRATSGHLYCSIKDELSSLSIVLWASSARQLKFKPEKGQLVRCVGKPNVYNKSGRLQVIVSKMEPAGDGALAQKFEELRKKLSEEGLFALERKRAIPFLPKAIGIVSSAQGAAIHDIMTRLQERMPQVPVYLVDVRVQGEGAAKEIAEGIKFFNEQGQVDVIICGRGGGSLQDLWAFNEEVVVRAIFSSRIPVISAVGHEPDTTLADLVADLRAPTPTAAAEMVVPRRVELLRILSELDRRLRDYERWLMPKSQQLDELSLSLAHGAKNRLQNLNLKLEVLNGKINLLNPVNQLNLQNSKLKQGEQRFFNSAQRYCDQKRASLKAFVAKLEALNPSSILERGYSITRSQNHVVTSSSQLLPEVAVEIQFRDGFVKAKVQ
jgi:exodeoxyribonuclease VII large subunit